MRTITLTLLLLVGFIGTPSEASAAIGPGWRGWSWYPSSTRPVAPYYGTANKLYGYEASSVRAFNYYYHGDHAGRR